MNIAEITVSGNVGQPPEIKEVNGTKVANFSIAVNENYRDKSGEQQSKTHWFNVEAWDGKPKEKNGKKIPSGVVTKIIEPLVQKGSTLYVRGFPQIDTYEQEGVQKKAFKIKIAGMSSQIRLAGSKPQDGANGTSQVKSKTPANGGKDTELDDEIPF